MKILVILYVIGVICGIVGNLILRLEVIGYIREKKRQGVNIKNDFGVSLAASIKTIVQILTPIYHYFILLGAMNTPREKLLKAIDDTIERYSSKSQ